MPDSKLCPQCGRTYPADDRFCTVDGAALLASGNDGSLIGSVLAERYLVQDKLGEGGMGEVYLAEHVRMKRKVAVKLMRSWTLGDPVAVSRFHREAENASQITHPNVAQVYDFGETADGMIYLAMEFVPGEPLSRIIQREGRLHMVRAAEIVRQTAHGLVAAHAMGILHRDLKPDNVMVAKTRAGTDVVKLVDFGIARVMNRGTQQFTSTGMIVGTPDYMSPEQLAGDTLDERSDNYALALIAFEILTGETAFPGGGSGEALLARLTNKGRQLSDVLPGVAWPDSLQAAFAKALASEPAARYADAMEFAAELDGAVSQMALSADEQAYLVALSQRSITPARVSAVHDSATPARAMPVSAVQTPPGEMFPPLTGGRDAVVPPPRVTTPTVPTPAAGTPISLGQRVSSEPPRSAPAVSAESARVEVPAGPSEPGLFTATVREDTPPAPEAAVPRRSRAPLLIGIVLGVTALGALVFKGRAPTKIPEVVPSEVVQSAVPPPAAASEPSTAAPPPEALPTAAVPVDSERIARARNGVFAIASTGGKGTAFLVDPSGIVLTSASLLPRDARDGVQLFVEADRIVRGTVVAVDSAHDVATLLISMRWCRRCRALDLAPADSGALPAAGDSVVALPMNGRASSRPQRMALGKVSALGYASSVRLPASSAGAPVLSARNGTVIALAARRKDGTTGLVPAAALRDELARSKALRASRALLPSDSLFWSWPSRAVEDAVLRDAEKRAESELAPYKMIADGFALLAMTPQVMAWRAARTKPSSSAVDNPFAIPDASGKRPADPIAAWSDWNAYRSERRAVIVVQVTPERASFPEMPSGVVDFKRGDFASMKLLRDGQELVPIQIARIPAVSNVDEYRAKKREVYNAGVYVYHPADFAPKGGSYAAYEAVIVDAKRPHNTTRIALPPAMLQAINRDLAPWQR